MSGRSRCPFHELPRVLPDPNGQQLIDLRFSTALGLFTAVLRRDPDVGLAPELDDTRVGVA